MIRRLQNKHIGTYSDVISEQYVLFENIASRDKRTMHSPA